MDSPECWTPAFDPPSEPVAVTPYVSDESIVVYQFDDGYTELRPIQPSQSDPARAQIRRVPQARRRLDRRLGCGGRPRGIARSTSRGGDSGDSSDEPEPGPRSGRPLLLLVRERWGRVNRLAFGALEAVAS